MATKKTRARRSPKSRYEVIVGNIGTVYDGASATAAKKAYRDYVALSLSGHGRAGGEGVTLIRDEDIIAEHASTIDGDWP